MSRDTGGVSRANRSDNETDAGGVGRREVLRGLGASLVGVAAIVGTTDTVSAAPEDAPGGEAMGGGSGYGRVVTRQDANVVVDSAAGIADALAAASEGDVVFVTGDATIEVGDDQFEVPAGVTFASNRGQDGSPGALLTTDDEPDAIVRVSGANSRVTGFRLRGPHTDTYVTHEDGISFDNETADGVRVVGTNSEVDNNDIAGFTHAGVAIKGEDDGRYIHHNYVHQNNTQGLGYGVAVGYGDDLNPTIEYNYFDANRHSVTSTGENYGYTARYNHVGPTTVMHPIDIHDPGSENTTIVGNVVEPLTRTWDDNCAHAIDGFDDTEGVVRIADNWFWSDTCTFDVPTDDSDVDVWDNHYGEDADIDFADVIPNHPGAADRPWA